MRYGSVCSGVEAASLAWEKIGWEPVFFSEIEPFPCAVLESTHKDVPNLGDMTKIRIDNDTIKTDNVSIHGRIDLLVGGTPCQSYSVAGKREGNRGVSGLSLDYIRLAFESSCRWIVWENVPGALTSTDGLDFKAFVSGLTGHDVPVPGDGWKNAGIVTESDRKHFGIAWRVLDAQYARVDGFPRAIPQRRRRVFLVGYRGESMGGISNWRRAAQVLFERASMSRDNPPRRKTEEDTAGGTEGCAGGTDSGLGVTVTTNMKNVMPTLSTDLAKRTNNQQEREGGIFWNGNQYAETLTVKSDLQRMPDKNRMQVVIENS